MLTVTCHFQFPDGSVALATVNVPSPHTEKAVAYAGAAELIKDKVASADAAFLKLWSQQQATKLGATLTVSESGSYDWWGE